jgi:dUTP pyrophosphatase
MAKKILKKNKTKIKKINNHKFKEKISDKDIIKNKKNQTVIKVKRIDNKIGLPSYLYDSDVGFDLRANESIKLFPGEQKEVKTGIIIEIPEGCVGLIRDRAGIVTKMGVHTAAGTFDPGFRGEVSIFLINLSEETRYVEQGMRIAQMIIIPVIKPKIIEVKELSSTERGDKGFGSTGIKELEKLDKEFKKFIKED